MTTKRSLWMTLFWTLAALVFAYAIVYPNFGGNATMQFVTVFSLEKMLSMDNLLVMSLIFKYFGVTPRGQRRALTIGLTGAVVSRATLISGGVYFIDSLTWLLYGFAGFLLYSGYKMMTEEGDDYDPEESVVISFIRKNLGNLGLFVCCIVAVEVSDIMFAVDSIPASFGVSQNAFIIISANLFAVMGLRSLYHAVANGINLLHGIEKYIGAVLVLVGLNVFSNHFWIKVPEAYLMGAVFSILCAGVLACQPKQEKRNV